MKNRAICFLAFAALGALSLLMPPVMGQALILSSSSPLAIANVTGTLSAGNPLTITGTGFGSGPTVVIFDNFDDSQSAGTAIDTTAKVGTWTAIEEGIPIYDDTDYSGGSSYVGIEPDFITFVSELPNPGSAAAAVYDHTGNAGGEKHLSGTGEFAGYTHASGDKIWLRNATGGVADGAYAIASKVDDNAVLLSADAGLTADATDVDGDKDAMQNRFHKTFTAATECYFTYQVLVPNGFTFPGETTQDTLQSGGSLKFLWVFDENSGDDDTTIPSHAGFFDIGSNDLDAPDVGGWTWSQNTPPNAMGDAWWAFDVWNRVTLWARAGADPYVDDGEFFWETINSVDGFTHPSQVKFPLFLNGTPPNEWEQFTFIGLWNTNGAEQSWDSKLLFDDVYVACGANAQARVEICNASTRATSNKCMIVP